MQFLPALLIAVATLAAARVLPQPKSPSHALNPIFPIEIELRDWQTNLPIDKPVGIVAGFDTTLYVVTASGKIFLTDIKSGRGSLLNPGGDDQRFAGICLDSRGPGTLYATGADTGLVFAFNRRGQLIHKYQITKSAKDGGTAFLANCIQTRYQLLITDAHNPSIYYLELVDEGPLRGFPSVPSPTAKYQGVRIAYDGDWRQLGRGFNAFGVEWSQKFNETAYIMNSETGQLFTMGVKKDNVVPALKKVEVEGRIKVFPGALFILFDSTNENVLYISMPHLNAIAVLEVSRLVPGKAKFIRYLTNILIDGPVAVGEYGDWIFPISGHFKRGKPRNQVYTIVQMPRHAQIISSSDPDEEFTTFYDKNDAATPEMVPRSEVEEALKSPPPETGEKAPLPKSSPDYRPPAMPGTPSATNDNASDGNENDPTSPTNPTETPTVSSSNSPVPAPGTTSSDEDPSDEDPSDDESSDDGASGDRPNSIFGSASLQPVDEESRACFPSEAAVRLDSGHTVVMKDVKIGDRVMVGWDENGLGMFSDVYMFSHQDESVMSWFVSIEGSGGESLEISGGHYMYVNGKLAKASTVRPGHMVGTRNGKPIRAKSVRGVRRRGLYNPQTVSGDIVVGGLQVSTYTSAVEPIVAAAILSPLRAVHRFCTELSELISCMLAHSSGRIPELIPRGRTIYL